MDLGVAGRGVSFLLLDLDFLGPGGLALLDRDEFVLAAGYSHAAAVDRQPAGGDQDLAVGAEGVLDGVVIDGGETLGELELGVGKEDRNEALHDHVVELHFRILEFDHPAGRNDGEVVGDLGVVEDTLLEGDAVLGDGVGGPFCNRKVRPGQFPGRAHHILQVIPRAGSASRSADR